MTSTRWTALTGALFLAIGASVAAAERITKADPPVSLQTRETWWETMLASREALVQQEAAAERQADAQRQADPVLKAFQPLRIELSSHEEPRKIKVRIAGMKQLHLGCTGQTEAFLADPQLIGRDGKAAALTLAKARVNRGRDGWSRESREPIVWGKQKFTTALLMSNSEVCLELDAGAEWLEGVLGTRSQKEPRHVEFWVHWRSLADIQAKAIAARRSLTVAVAEAFPSPVDARQQRVETAAGIWRADWKRGDLAELAARYAAACGAGQKQAAEALARRCKAIAELNAVRDLFYAQYVGPRLALARKTLEMVERAAPRPELAAELASLEKQSADSQGNSNGEALYRSVCNLRRKIVLSHPALDFPKLLINKRSCSLPEHMCDQYFGRFSQEAPGLVVLEDWKEKPRETVLLPGKLPRGGTIQPDLSCDGKRVLFAFADHSSARTGDLRAYYIYEYSFETQ